MMQVFKYSIHNYGNFFIIKNTFKKTKNERESERGMTIRPDLNGLKHNVFFCFLALWVICFYLLLIKSLFDA